MVVYVFSKRCIFETLGSSLRKNNKSVIYHDIVIFFYIVFLTTLVLFVKNIFSKNVSTTPFCKAWIFFAGTFNICATMIPEQAYYDFKKWEITKM